MQRNLNNRIDWDAEGIELEGLDWKNNPSDFDRLCDFVIQRANQRLSPRGQSLQALVPVEELRREIRAAAELFQEKHVSLPLFVYLRLQTYVAGRLKKN